MTLSFWWSSALSFSPTFEHLWRRTAVGQWLPFSIFLRGHRSPWGRCFAAATWRDWTSTVDSVLRLPSPWTIHAADSVRRGPARLGCTAILLYVMRQIFTKMDCSPVCMVRTESWGPWCPFSSWQEGGLGQRSSERGVLDLAVSLLLSLWTHPVTWLRFPQQNEDTDSVVFQEVLLLLWNVLYEWLAISKGLARSLQHLGTI